MKRAMRRMRKTLVLVACIALVAGLAIGGTVAWLADSSQEVTNTFTVGDIDIKLYEHANKDATDEITSNTLEIIPSVDLYKDPTVEFEEASEPCWLFIEVNEQNWPTAKEADGTTLKVKYEIDTTVWTKLDNPSPIPANGVTVYYKELTAEQAAKGKTYNIIKDKTVYVSDNLTKTEMDAITTPTLTFKAYAIQKANVNTVADAWQKVKAQTYDATSGANKPTTN